MKKSNIILFFIFLITSLVYSQTNVAIKFKNGTEIHDLVNSDGFKITSLENKTTYNSDSISEVTVHHSKESYKFYFLNAKIDTRYKKDLKVIGTKVYSKGEIEIFAVHFYFIGDIKYLKPLKINYSKQEVYIRRKKDKFVYSIGCIDGIGCKNIKKRLKKFFYDCPKLIKGMRKNKIKDWEILKIVNLYYSLINE
ncbi:hypothetical protein OD91_0394 [Lutibacter sp. Hel_I_33_5]|uniref:hypothetical protein n=1 Tax=Lutibacter sp. Hel_I_33_5 TaxID=1566289 RepID=UPI0011A85135|nr:hypothetical protein [Lutibacter sp. Hel_I_33_5]TVZ55150.1 hypothetical protein OD91_0394 [Lutibacter sp. Hel_I_33_5]